MDPDKVLKFLVDNFADWSRVVYLTLVRPVSRFELAHASGELEASGIIGAATEAELWLSPKLLSFAAVSALLGITLNSLLPNRVPGPQLLAAVAVVFAFWFLYGSLAHIVCISLRGSGQYLHTLSVSVQVSATLYVIASFLSLLTAGLSSVPAVASALSSIPVVGQHLADEPAQWFFLIGAVLASIYQPLALRAVHKLGWFRTILIGLLPYGVVWLSLLVYRKTGVMPPLGTRG